MLGFVVGLAAEARIAARFGCPVRIGGGTPAGARLAATLLIEHGATALVSFGLAGGLDPGLRPGTLILPASVLSEHEIFRADQSLASRFGGVTGHSILAGHEIAATAAAKRQLYAATQASGIDLESGAVARAATLAGLPFIVIRAICDPAERDLPQAALIALGGGGRVGLQPVLRSIVSMPRQIPTLMRLARDAAAARRALVCIAERYAGGALPCTTDTELGTSP